MLTLVPRSPLASAATELLVATSPPHLVNHCLRTHQFGMALAGVDGQEPDPELVYLAAALHDLGLTERYDDGPDGFEENGAAAADAFLRAEGFDAPGRAVVLDAIRLHLLLATPEDPRAEVATVARGTSLDVVGFGYDRLEPAFISQVVAAHPRLEFKRELAALLHVQATVRPSSTIATYVDRGMLDMIAATAFAS